MPRPNRGIQLERNKFGIIEMRWSENGRSKRSSTGSRDMAEAEKIRANFVLLEERERRSVADAPMMVGDAIGDPEIPGKDYWTEHVNPNVVDKETAKYARTKLLAHFGHLAVRDITPDDVKDYVDRRSKKPRAEWTDRARMLGPLGRPSVNHTISRELSVLNAAIQHQVRERRLDAKEAPFIKLPGTSQPRERWLTEAEADRLLVAADKRHKYARADREHLPRVYLFIALALNTASRKTALLQMKWDQIDFVNNRIYLNPTGRAQTKKRRPTVPISKELRPLLERAWREAGGHTDPDGTKETHVLKGGGSIRTAFTKAVKRAGLGEDVTPHVLRHTWGTWAAQAGKSMFEIAGVMGDTIKTVEKNYAHHHPDYLQDTVNDIRPSARGKPELRVVA